MSKAEQINRLRDETNHCVRAMLNTQKNGMTTSRLLKELSRFMSTGRVEYTTLGHKSFEDYLRSIPHVVSLTKLPTGYIQCRLIPNQTEKQQDTGNGVPLQSKAGKTGHQHASQQRTWGRPRPERWSNQHPKGKIANNFSRSSPAPDLRDKQNESDRVDPHLSGASFLDRTLLSKDTSDGTSPGSFFDTGSLSSQPFQAGHSATETSFSDWSHEGLEHHTLKMQDRRDERMRCYGQDREQPERQGLKTSDTIRRANDFFDAFKTEERYAESDSDWNEVLKRKQKYGLKTPERKRLNALYISEGMNFFLSVRKNFNHLNKRIREYIFITEDINNMHLSLQTRTLMAVVSQDWPKDVLVCVPMDFLSVNAIVLAIVDDISAVVFTNRGHEEKTGDRQTPEALIVCSRHNKWGEEMSHILSSLDVMCTSQINPDHWGSHPFNIVMDDPESLESMVNKGLLILDNVSTIVIFDVEEMVHQFPQITRLRESGKNAKMVIVATALTSDVKEAGRRLFASQSPTFVTSGPGLAACFSPPDKQNFLVSTNMNQKRAMLVNLLRLGLHDKNVKHKALIFTENTALVKKFCLWDLSVDVDELSEGMSTDDVVPIINKFVQDHKSRILIVHSSMSFGVPLPKVHMLVNFEVPTDANEYPLRLTHLIHLDPSQGQRRTDQRVITLWCKEDEGSDVLQRLGKLLRKIHPLKFPDDLENILDSHL